MSYYKKIADEILTVDDAVSHVGIIAERGSILHTAIREGRKNLLSQKEQEVLAADLSVMKLMQGLFDDSLGRVTFMHTVRDKVHQLVYYIDDKMVYVSCERNIDSRQIMEISNKIESIITNLIR